MMDAGDGEAEIGSIERIFFLEFGGTANVGQCFFGIIIAQVSKSFSELGECFCVNHEASEALEAKGELRAEPAPIIRTTVASVYGARIPETTGQLDSLGTGGDTGKFFPLASRGKKTRAGLTCREERRRRVERNLVGGIGVSSSKRPRG